MDSPDISQLSPDQALEVEPATEVGESVRPDVTVVGAQIGQLALPLSEVRVVPGYITALTRRLHEKAPNAGRQRPLTQRQLINLAQAQRAAESMAEEPR